MTEKEFLTLYKERRNLKSIREAKERLDSFWKALFDVLDVEEKVIIKDWGIFEKNIKSGNKGNDDNRRKESY